MKFNRRRLLESLAVTMGSGTAAKAADPITVDVLRSASTVHGTNLTDDRLRILKPVLEQRIARLRVLHDLEIDDAIGPTQGILVK